MPRGATVIPPAGTAPGLLLPLGARPRARAARPAARARGGLAQRARARADRRPARARRHAPAPHPARLRRRASRRSPAPSPRPAATPAARARRSAPARSRSRSPSARSPRPRRRSTRSSRACTSSSATRSSPRTSGRWPSIVLERAARARPAHRRGRVVHRGPRGGARSADIPGSSDVLLGGVIAYANALKRGLLGRARRSCSPSTARSRPSARGPWPRARGRRRAPRSGIAVTGVAGPGGGSARKPVGLVYLHVSAPGVERGQELQLPGDRAQVRELSAVAALQLVRTTLP